MHLCLDFETRSAVTNLKQTGAWPYAEHPSTDIQCLALRVKGGPSHLWAPDRLAAMLPLGHGLPLVDRPGVLSLLEQADIIEAHNVEFERAVWWHIMSGRNGFPDLPFHKMRCSAAKASMHSLPRSLDLAVKALGLEQQKDAEGYKTMLKMCKPRAPRKDEKKALDSRFGLHPVYRAMWEAYETASGTGKLNALCAVAAANWSTEVSHMLLWHWDAQDYVKLCRYCLQDTAAEEALSGALTDLPSFEQTVFQYDQVINTRGFHVDRGMVEAALGMIERHEGQLLLELMELTNHRVESPKQVAATRTWLKSRGLHLDDLQAETVRDALKRNDLEPGARRVLEIRQSLARSSTAKYQAAAYMLCRDDRIRGFAMYHGAGTGRWAGKGIQGQNLPRGVFDLDKPASAAAFWRAVDLVRAGDLAGLSLEFGDPMPILASTIRPIITAFPGCELLCADLSAIEGRGLAWLAGEEWVLEAYRAYDRGEGPDMYMVTAGKILGKDAKDITPKERKSPGKVADLACGYYGGPGAIAKFNGQCPEQDRPRFALRAMRLKVKKLRDKAAAESRKLTPEGQPPVMADVLEGYNRAIADLDAFVGQEPTWEKVAVLTTAGWEPATEEELFENWARDVVTKWRKARPATVALWKGLEEAALAAVDTGLPQTYGCITYLRERGFLTCLLPSGRKLYYPYPKIVNREMPWSTLESPVSKQQLAYWGVDAETKRWAQSFAHGGVLTENIVQAICRDILAEALVRVEQAGFPVVLHVHDEVVAETKKGERTLEEFIALLTRVPVWADGFPISAAGWVGERYRKD